MPYLLLYFIFLLFLDLYIKENVNHWWVLGPFRSVSSSFRIILLTLYLLIGKK